jgi:hypothetical protein
MASVEEIQWRISRDVEGLKESFMGAICPASLHTCHPDMKRVWVLLRGLWLSLFQEPRPSRCENGEFSHITFDSLRIARSSNAELPSVHGAGSAASVILEQTESVDIGTSRSESTSIVEPSNHWLIHHSSGTFFMPENGTQRTVCTLFTSRRPCLDERSSRYLIKFGHDYHSHDPPGRHSESRGPHNCSKPQYHWLPITVRLKITFFLDMYSGNHAPLTVAMCEEWARCLTPQDAKGFLHFQAVDLSDDTHVNFLLRLSWTGVIAVANSAPPCETYSAVRERPGPGPPQLRSEEDVAGT